MGSMIEFARPDGGRTKGYLADAGKKRPGIVVIQEWWGLNDQIKSVADRFAKAGITALAPDLFKGKVTAKPDEASHLMNSLDFPDATHQDLQGAVKHLKSLCPKVAVTGFCMGGALALAAGVHIPEIGAAICLYGIPPKEFADPAKIQVPFQGHFATKDDWITPAKVRELENALKKAGVDYEIYSYNADHAFCNDRRPEVYDPAAAKLVWDRSLKFLAAKL